MQKIAYLLFFIIVAACLASAQSSRSIFQSNLLAPNFGYDYEEDTRLVPKCDPGTQSSCQGARASYNRIFMDAKNTDYSYLGLGLGEKSSYTTAFRIQAEQWDGRDSGFAAVYSMIPGTPSASTKGDGKVTGSFQDSVKVKFREDGNDWSLQLTQVKSGQEEVLATGRTGRSNEHRLFHFHVDHRQDNAPRIEVQDFSGARILESATHASFQGRSIEALWFVGYGFGSNERSTILVADLPSTVVYDTDPRPPMVESVGFLPSVVDDGEPVRVQATITDDVAVTRAIVYYRVNGGPANQVEMTHQGGHLYEGNIPGQAGGTRIVFRVEAHDGDGMVGHSEREYSYTVGSGQPIHDEEDNSERPRPPPGSGSIDQASWKTFGVAFLLVLMGVVASVLVVRQYGQRRGWIAMATAAAVIAIYLAFELNPWNIKDRWSNILAAMAAVGVLTVVSVRIRDHVRRQAK